MSAAGLEDVVRRILSSSRRALEDYSDLFLPGHVDRLVTEFKGSWEGKIEVVRAGAYLVAYKPGFLRKLRKPTAEWLAKIRERWPEVSSMMPFEADRAIPELINVLEYIERVIFGVVDDISVIAVVGVDDASGKAFVHLVPPNVATAAALAPRDALADEAFVRELLGFDSQPWEEPERREGVRLRVQGDLVLRLTPIDVSEGLPAILSLAYAVVAGYKTLAAALHDAVEALEQASRSGDLNLSEAFNTLFAGALARRVPCARRMYNDTVAEEMAHGRLGVVEADVSAPARCSLSELAGPGAAALLAAKPPFSSDFDVEIIEVSGLVESWRRALQGGLDAIAYLCKAIVQLHAGIEYYEHGRDIRLPLGAVARLRGGHVVVKVENAATLLAMATVAEAFRALGLMLLGRGGDVVAEALGREALPGPASIELEAHSATFEEASVIVLPEALRRILYLKNTLQAMEPLVQLLEAHRARSPRAISSLARSSPDDAVEVARLAARLTATYTPSTLLVLPRGQKVTARHPEHGVAEAEVPWPAIVEPGHMPHLTLLFPEF